MTKINVGDKVMITNVAEIEFGTDYWRDGDVVRVMQIDYDGDLRLETTQEAWIDDVFTVDGVPTFLVCKDEFHALAKLLPINGGDTQ